MCVSCPSPQSRPWYLRPPGPLSTCTVGPLKLRSVCCACGAWWGIPGNITKHTRRSGSQCRGAETGLADLAMWTAVRMLRRSARADVRVNEGHNSLIKAMANRCPRIGLPLLSARVNVKKELGLGSRGASKRWSSIRPALQRVLESSMHADHEVGGCRGGLNPRRMRLGDPSVHGRRLPGPKPLPADLLWVILCTDPCQLRSQPHPAHGAGEAARR